MTLTAEDRAWRREGLGASDIAALLGLSPWESPFGLWADKVGLLPDDEDDREDFDFGHFMELAVGPWFEKKTGLHVACQQLKLAREDVAWQRCILDGRVFESAASEVAPLGGLEIKTAYDWRSWDEIPAHYQCQAQWQMHVDDLERVWFATLHGRRLETYVLERDQHDIDLLVAEATEFWNEHVVAGVPPDVDGSDATLDALKAVYPQHVDDKAVDLDPDTAACVDLLKAAKVDKAVAEQRENEAKAQLQAALGDAEAGLVGGERVVSWRTQSARRLDGKALREAHPDIAKQFTNETTQRVLRTHTPKEKKA